MIAIGRTTAIAVADWLLGHRDEHHPDGEVQAFAEHLGEALVAAAQADTYNGVALVSIGVEAPQMPQDAISDLGR